MNLGLRLGVLGFTGAAVSGLALASWVGLLWWAQAGSVWLPLLLQLAVTVSLAAAVGWWLHRFGTQLQRTLAQLREQAQALEQGRFVIVDEPPLLDALPLARDLNAAVRRVQSALCGTSTSGTEALQRLAPVDLPTGLDSRFGFLQHLAARLSDAQAPDTSVLLLRVLPGSQPPELPALQELAELLRAYPQRVADAFVGRLAEHDFALCLPAHDVADESAASLMAAVQTTASRPRCVIAAVDHLGGLPLGSALAVLDLAIVRAEGAGAGRVECQSARHEGPLEAADAAARGAIVDALRKGQARLAEFPVLARDGELLHLECPMRLRLAAHGADEAAERWLDLATRSRLMTQIDLAALELALVAIAGDERPRCVHVSAQSLATAGFVSAVRTRLEAAPAAAALLWIEIAELSFQTLPPRVRNAGTVWRRCGARVGIEHAGAALRDLLRLGELDLDYVKVDAGFVHGVAGDERQRERAQALVALSHEMGALVIAEGVDDVADMAALWGLGFDGVTGQAATRRYPSRRQPVTAETATGAA